MREKPLPFPPEPLRAAGVALTRRSLARADARGGRRDLWLRIEGPVAVRVTAADGFSIQ